MEHIVQFGISIDDEAIRQSVEQSAKNKVVSELKSEIKSKLITSWGDLSPIAKDIITEVLEDNKDEILQKASAMVADSMKRSKKYREALSKIVEDIE